MSPAQALATQVATKVSAKAGEHAARADLREGYIEDASEGPFDAAACLLTLHFLERSERVRTAAKIRRRMKPGAPLHMHIAEQTGEVEEVLAHHGARPVEWLFANHDVDERWCLIHCTHLSDGERRSIATSGAVAGLCPITESSLGDGIFDGARYLDEGGTLGVGSDSNIRIALSEEMRTLEYSQRLRDRHRAVLATKERSCGRRLFDEVVKGGARAAGRASGAIREDAFADLVALDRACLDLDGLSGDTMLDAWIFAGDDRAVAEVWAAGRHVVSGGRHVRRDAIEARYRAAMKMLRAAL